MKKLLCKFAVGTLGLIIGLGALALSFAAVTHITGAWGAADYWLVWFSFFSFVLGLVAAIPPTIAATFALVDLCGGPWDAR